MATPAVGSERQSRVIGYKIASGNFAESSPNLPQRIAILGEANTANQAGLSTAPFQILSATDAGKRYGYGSPIYNIARILLPIAGEGVGGIPVIVYPQLAAVGAVARVMTLTVTGTATAGGTHYVVVAGRSALDGSTYGVNIASGDTAAQVAAKIADAINAVIGSPVTATVAGAVVTLTAKWAGLTSQDVKAFMSTTDAGSTLGLTYAVAETTAGSGTPDIGAGLNAFGGEWNTFVVNSYGTVPAILNALETFNGVPDNNTPTGRYAAILMKPFVAVTGSVADDPTTSTDARASQVTIAIAPAPLSAGLPMEAAANMTLLAARTAQDAPHLDISGKYYPDMPGPAGTPAMASYNTRDSYVKKGCSTVDVIGGRYVAQDFVTTYHPAGEVPPQFRYVRNLTVDFNIRYGYLLLEQVHVVDHALAADNDIVTASDVVKPKDWKGILISYATELSKRALTADASFMQGSIVVKISPTNPDRLETTFKYKRTGTARISSTVVEAGFNFGDL